jgi:transposase-like protein
MNSEIFSKFQKRIINENINNTGPRRKFSQKLKKDIVTFLDEQNISSNNAANLLGIGFSTIEKWRSRSKKQFHKVNISIPTKEHISKKRKSVNVNAVKTNQIVLIILTVVLISEVLFLHLNV